MTNTETLSTTALDVQAIRKKLEKHFSDLPAAELDTDECRRLFIVRRLLRHAYSLCVRGDAQPSRRSQQDQEHRCLAQRHRR